MRKSSKTFKSLIVMCLCFAWVIWLKEDARIGIFEGKSNIRVETGFFTRTDRKISRVCFTYQGKQISLPYSSIAYWESY